MANEVARPVEYSSRWSHSNVRDAKKRLDPTGFEPSCAEVLIVLRECEHEQGFGSEIEKEERLYARAAMVKWLVICAMALAVAAEAGEQIEADGLEESSNTCKMVDGQEVGCELQQPQASTGQSDAEMGHEPSSSSFAISSLPRLSSDEFKYVYDTQGILDEKTVAQLVNVSGTISKNKTLTIIWMTIPSLPKETSSFKSFAREVLGHIFDDSHLTESGKVSRKMKKAMKKAALFALRSDKRTVSTFTGRMFRKKISVTTVKRAVRKVQKLMKKEGYDEGLLKLAEMIYKSAFRKNSVFDSLRSFATLIVPAIAFFVFFNKKGGGFFRRSIKRPPKYLETLEMKKSRFARLREAYGITDKDLRQRRRRKEGKGGLSAR
eukprot:jgi/Bigna1/86936/estExt_fgenesh1_pg.C_150109